MLKITHTWKEVVWGWEIGFFYVLKTYLLCSNLHCPPPHQNAASRRVATTALLAATPKNPELGQHTVAAQQTFIC